MFADQLSLRAWLSAHGIDVTRWGTGQAKTIEHLWHELSVGECTLAAKEDRVIRTVRGCSLLLYRADERGEWWWLVEREQRFVDGRVRKRDLDISIGEKCLTGEDVSAAATRALAEELAIVEPVALSAPSWHESLRTSESYPGLETAYTTAVFEVVLPEHLVREEYVERQADKTTTWHWRRVPLPMIAHCDGLASARAAR